MFFKSPNVWVHLARGASGLGLVYLVLQYASVLGWWALIPGIAAVALLGGCPMCWLVGFCQIPFGKK